MASVQQSAVAVDYAFFSFPVEDWRLVVDDVVGWVLQAGGRQTDAGGCELGGSQSVRFGLRGSVGWLQVSGAGIRAFQAASCWESVLVCIAEREHRVTGMHACVDVRRNAGSVLPALERRARRGTIAFTRKVVPAEAVRAVRSQRLYGKGVTGTLYIGRRTSSVWGKVYDKRNEILDRAEAYTPELVVLNDPGPWTRYELAFGRKVGLTMGDILEPAPVFWHHAKGLQLVPEGAVRAWVAGESGYVLPPREPLLPAVQLELLLERSVDLRRCVTLADAIGAEGRRYVARTLQRFVLNHSSGDSPVGGHRGQQPMHAPA